ncbi:S41 family peptidase [Trichothermofontia sichuanensis B231]|uniref:carboxyl-terminal processing protease CtpC n=1 Tax=Trichothermofontia sichuanensis TaxID=3045816 RepID=UPI002247118E|nr:carboxyl-terminal processing protease CtpC [Trichothermofontia sichuanensis]UZQ53774.1 S41 family peptidase [Trichothermofontia sichuanensis B231]
MTVTTNRLVIGATALMVTAVTVTGAGMHLSKSQAFFRESPKELIDEVWQIIDRTYVDATFNQVDWRAVRTEYLNRTYANQKAAYDAIREMLGKLDDPYTRFMDPDEFRNMQVDTSGELTGVGIQLAQDEKTKKLVVVSPIEDTPAAQAGLLPKDIIIKIDDKSTEGMDVNQAVNLIRGRVGTEVVLTVQRGDQQLVFPLKRARIEIHPVRYSLRQGPEGKIGYIRLVQFSSLAPKEMREAIEELERQQVDGYILDLRSNPGGLLQASVSIARLWLKEGEIVSTVSRVGSTDHQRANNSQLTNKPLVVLVNGGSASASEILSGALQDNDRAVLVGTKTFGKGLVQSVRPLGDGSGLAVTIAKYFTPDGNDINKAGIKPDIEVELTEAQIEALSRDGGAKIGTLDDPQFVRALEVLNQKIAATRGNRVESRLP